MLKRINCWEFMSCGREQGGLNVEELGVCPVSVETSADGLNGGKNGGRICWAIAGGFDDGKLGGKFTKEKVSCFLCDFYRKVLREEGFVDFRLVTPEQEYTYSTLKR